MICTSIKIIEFPEVLSLPKSVDFAEYRFDDTQYSSSEISKIIHYNNIKSIATYRSENTENITKFNTLKSAIEYGISYLDIELDFNFEMSCELIQIARKNQVSIICSYHNYLHTPDRYELEEIIDSLLSIDSDIIKIACKSNSQQDTLRLLNLYSEKKISRLIEKKLISLPIGNEWKLARLSTLELGAPFIYASLSKSAKTADGQIDIESLITILDLLK